MNEVNTIIGDVIVFYIRKKNNSKWKNKSLKIEKDNCVNSSTDIINENEAIQNLGRKFLVKYNDICHSIIF